MSGCYKYVTGIYCVPPRSLCGHRDDTGGYDERDEAQITAIKKPAIRRVFRILTVNLQTDNVSSRWAFSAVGDFKLYALTFSQSFEAVALDCREMYEYIFAAIFRSNETESFRFIKPLNVTFDLRHLYYLYMKNGH